MNLDDHIKAKASAQASLEIAKMFEPVCEFVNKNCIHQSDSLARVKQLKDYLFAESVSRFEDQCTQSFYNTVDNIQRRGQ